MPLTYVKIGEESLIKRVSGHEEQRLFLASLGFVIGSHVTVVNESGGNLIVSVKESRVALGREMAERIIV